MNANSSHRRIVSRSRSLFAAAASAILVSSSPALAATKDWNAGSGNWSTSGNWLPGGMPTSLDSVLIGTTAPAQNASVMLNVTSTVASLSITDGMKLDTNGFPLTVGTNVSVAGQNTVGILSYPSSIVVRSAGPNPGLKVDGNLSLSDRARLELPNSGTLQVGGLLGVDSLSTISGKGTIDLTRNSSPAMLVNGKLEAGIGGLTINQLGTGLIDLDGGTIGDQTIDITASNLATNQFASLTINGTDLADAFDDHLRIGGGNTLNMNLDNGWTLGSTTAVDFVPKSNGFADYATIDGGPLTAAGTWNVGAFAIASLQSAVTVTSTAKVNVAKNGNVDFSGEHATISGGVFTTYSTNPDEGAIEFYTTTTYQGNVTFNGVARQSADANVATASTIQAGCFDLDGYFENSKWQISNPLTINADSIDAVGDVDAAFNGTISIFNGGLLPAGALTVNLPVGQSWTMAGTLNLSGTTFFTSTGTIYGSAVRLKGLTNVSYRNNINSRVHFDAGSITTIADSALLRLDGGQAFAPNEINAGIIAGPGTLGASSGSVLMGNGTIATKIQFEGSSALLASGGVLQVSGDLLDVGQIGALAGGTLNVTHPWNTSVANSLRLYGGSVVGGAITNPGVIEGYGTASPASLSSSGSISALSDGLLILDPVGVLDLDGSAGNGLVNAVNGDLRMIDNPSGFTGTANVGPGHSMDFVAGWLVEDIGTINLNGVGSPAVVKGDYQAVHGKVNATGDSRFEADTWFYAETKVSLPGVNDQLTMTQSTQIISGATFSGAGKLRNANGATMTPQGGSNVNVRLENAGVLSVAGPGTIGNVAAKSVAQSEEGEMQIDLGGPVAGTQFDRVIVSTSASVDGTLALSIRSNYNPAYLLSHEILHTGGAVSGIFGAISGVQLSSTKFLAVTYDADSVLVTAALPGDANLDGNVNFDDLLSLAQNYEEGGRSWAGGDFTGNGNVTFDDLLLLAQNYGAHLLNGDQIGVDSSMNFQSDWAMAQGMTPEPASLLALPTVGLLPTRRRR